ncbi:hypothetical protein EQG67_20725 [Kosakonia cowanii]|nr:hypothetical protein EQG67_20725 [Kosakonia cowanii]
MECSSQSFLCHFSIAGCGELPIMRLHRHGAKQTTACSDVKSEEKKILKFRVDSERGKRNIRHLATER